MVDVVDVMRGVDVVDIHDKRIVQHLTDDDIDSIQTFRLYKGKEYALVADVDWIFVPTINVSSMEGGLTMEGFTLDELRERKDPLPLPLVGFYGSTSRLLPLAGRELDNVVRFMRQHAGSRVKVTVNTSGTDDRQCYDIAMSRAMSIRNYMVKQGIDADRIVVTAYGNMMFKKGLKPAQVEIAFQ